ncbi:uncharacterized protein LOC131663277 [Phymastichus coffea]|uniref:uncharacterized protein LOC131663277 n=1 Tax=Phymastichus coffea TaxID=108790 RepID=UPI00273BB4A5|nr:uncharacterized protein LOC131663277 [Phymastichus coffea]
MSKKRVKLDIDYLEKKKKELAEKLKELKRKVNNLSSEEEEENSHESSTDDNDEIKISEEENKEDDQEEVNEGKNKNVKYGSRKNLRSDIKAILGNPNASKALDLPIYTELLESWKFYMAKGLPQDEKEKLLSKYASPEALQAPKLNEQIIAKISEKSVKKDTYRIESQKVISLALTAISAAISMVNDANEDEGVDPISFVERLTDAAKLLSHAQFQQTESRRACIIPLFQKNIREVLKSTTPDQSLFGNELTNVLKQMKEAEVLLENKKTICEYRGQFRCTNTGPTKIVLQRLQREKLQPRHKPEQVQQQQQVEKQILPQQELNVSLKIGGRLKMYYNEWSEITNSKFILKCIEGYEIPLWKMPKQKYFENRSIKDPNVINRTKQAIDELEKKGAIVLSKSYKNQFLSSYFLARKPNGAYRFILNLKKLNKFIKTIHFKLEDLKTVIKTVAKGDFMASIDMQDAYFLVPIHYKSQKFLMFKFQGKLYRFKCLPFGLSTCPYIFTKIVKPVSQKLRTAGFVSNVYLDDWLCIGKKYKECENNVLNTISLLERLGCVMNYKKSNLIPSKVCTYLGVLVKSEDCVIELTNKKKENILKILQRFKKLSACRILEFAKMLGKLVAACIAVEYGWLYTKLMERDKLRALNKSRGSYLGHMTISKDVLRDIEWWIKTLPNAQKCFKQRKIKKVIYTDASDNGWGATDNTTDIFGFWNDTEIEYHINYKELLTVKLALNTIADKIENCSILLRIDNTTAIAYINRMGGVRFQRYNLLARKIWQWAEIRNIHLIASYIPSRENAEADRLSRVKNPDTEWELNEKEFNIITKKFGNPSIDLFAFNKNFKCNTYISRFPDTKAWQIDAFTEKIPSEDKEVNSNGSDCIREALTKKDVPEESLDTMLSSLSKSTQKHYRVSLRKWLQFCEKEKVDLNMPKSSQIIAFLTKRYNEGCSYSNLNTDRSAISLISLNNIGEDKLTKPRKYDHKNCYKEEKEPKPGRQNPPFGGS